VVTHLLGEEGWACLCGHDFVLDRRVAVKLVRPDLDPRARGAQGTPGVEAQAGGLNHPSISVYDVGEFSGELCIAMELVEGQRFGGGCAQAPGPLEDPGGLPASRPRIAAAHRAGLITGTSSPTMCW
jgi:hypothetical protein